MDDFYDLLEVSEDASRADIRAAWREKARQYHPDVNDDDRANAQFKTLRTAYDVLSDDSKRSAYDRLGHADYVSKRLDGLPTAGMTRPNSSSESDRWQGRSSGSSDDASARTSSASTASGASRTRSSSRTRSATDGRSQSSARSAGSGTGSNRSTSTTSGASNSTRSSTANTSTSTRSSTANASSANRTSGTATRSSSGRRSSTASSRTASTSADAAEAGAGTAAGTETAAEATDADAASRNPLWYGWVATLLAGAVYLAGLAVYLEANAGALSSAAAGLATTPRAALLANHGFTPPGTFALAAAAAAPGPALAFPVAAALLAVVFAAVVARFGHGTAYLYLVGALAPLAALAVGPVVSVPALGATLALVVVLPVLGTALFLADVGRFLLAD